MSYSVLIIGLGQISVGYDLQHKPAEHVYTHARAFDLHPLFNVVAGVDPERQRRQTFAQTYGCEAFAEMETAFERHKPDVVIIAVPTELHCSVLKRVLELSHPRIILCEKPIAHDVKEAGLMVQACADRGVGFYVNYMRRSDPGSIEIKRRIDTGEISSVIKGVVWYSKGFFHNGSHFFNLLEYWLGPMRNSVLMGSGRLWDDADPEPDVHVSFERGDVVFLSAWEEAFSHYTVELLSPSGRLRYEQGGERIYWQSAGPDAHLKGYTVLSVEPETIHSGMDHYQWHVAEQLSRVLRGHDADLCSGAEALKTLDSMKRIFERR